MYHHWFLGLGAQKRKIFAHTEGKNFTMTVKERKEEGKSELICTMVNKMLLHYVKSALWSFLILIPIKAAYTFTHTCSPVAFLFPRANFIYFTQRSMTGGIYALNSIHNFLNSLSFRDYFYVLFVPQVFL
jgi:hypothetical protein